MKVAQVTSWGSAPVLSDAPDLPAPTGSQVQVKVVAVGVPRVVRGRALGVHSSSRGAPLPFDPTVDGIVQDEASGDLFYVSPNSAALFAERANVERHTLVRLAPGADAVSVATQVNPVASSWMALRVRTSDPDSVKGATVLVLGATSTSGRAAIAIARSLGAARIIGTSRSEDKLAAVQDLDERVVLQAPYTLPPTLGPVHIILDFVGGQAASGVLTSAQIEPGKELQYIHVGDLAGEETIAVPGRLLNARPVRITGSGMGAWGKQEIKKEINGLLGAITKLPRPEDLLIAKFSDIESVWDTEEAQTKRLVLVW
ncbi:hypothetical protein B0J18DRAFT_419636 [Chaetomium sp. MPI-SDFR-AT-0129]|uniref:Quinone oxidoreductase n=1 Tax=Dichotomopilus funicola TaxID=1934379 RepID=A0AAN6UWM2_9PEZI|nr:hypothetical protein B0J18DRAFT_419636 [Chaetomium sp. MPI-SDFR-AT-0129]KAK4140473.1 hypothetical protein C8A04DRAFT_39850 [Dichotomopilus funicola]